MPSEAAGVQCIDPTGVPENGFDAVTTMAIAALTLTAAASLESPTP